MDMHGHILDTGSECVLDSFYALSTSAAQCQCHTQGTYMACMLVRDPLPPLCVILTMDALRHSPAVSQCK